MRVAFAALLFLFASAAAALAGPEIDVLQRSKAAAGGNAWDAVTSVSTKFAVESTGLKGNGESVEDARTGAFSDRFQLGTFKGANGFDGNTVWEEDSSGQIAVQGAEEPRQAAISEAYRRSHSYWYADRAKAQISYVGQKSEAARSFQVVHIAPQGGRPFDMWFDAQSYILDRVVERTSSDTMTTFYSNYRPIAGKLMPHSWRTTNGKPKYDTVVNVTAIAFDEVKSATAFAPPAPPKRDFGFAGGGKTTTFPFTLVNNHIFLDVRLNGRSYNLIFDTGGLNVITPTVARELGLKLEGAAEAKGTGEQRMEASFTNVARMEIGGAVMENQQFVVIPLESFTAIEGKPITGIIGYEVFKRYVVGIDYENSRLTLSDPEGFAYRGPGARVAMELNGRTPEVMGEIDGVPGKFSLDTGARSSLDLMAPFVAKHNLVQRYGAKYQGVTGWGVGGAARSWIVRGKRLSLGGASVDLPVVELSQSQKGALSDPYLAGNVGGGVLSQFNIVWDYTHHQIFFEKNRLHGRPDVFDRAGFWANAGNGAFDVVDVIAGAPAEAAGLKVGDRVVGVNGKRALSEMSLPDLRMLKKGPVGTNLILDVERGGQRLQVNVLLRNLV